MHVRPARPTASTTPASPLLVLLAVVLAGLMVGVLALVATPSAQAAGGVRVDAVPVTVPPVEPYAAYEPQSTCSPTPKPGTVALGHWLVKTYGGRFGRIVQGCRGGGVSEHKEGRAFDWMLNARKAADRNRAARFLAAAFATGPSGQPAELARRMGIMYVIFDDHLYGSYREFRATPYLSAGCTSLAHCSRTLRHRDHMHISLSWAGARGQTSWYAGRVPGRAA